MQKPNPATVPSSLPDNSGPVPAQRAKTSFFPASGEACRVALKIIAGGLFARIIVASLIGFGVDKSYTLAVTRGFQLSWFDHPPVAFWMSWGAQSLFGTCAPHILLRLPFVLLFCATSFLLYRLTERLFGDTAGLLALLSFTLTPFFLLSAGGWIVPDGPLIFFLLLAANSAVGILFEDPSKCGVWGPWFVTGLFTGLAVLSKYTAIFFPLGLFLFLLLSPRHRFWLRNPGPWMAALLALIILSPVWIWNASNHWASFSFQLSRAVPAGNWRPDYVLAVVGGQAAYLLPWTFGGLFIAAGRTVKSESCDSPGVLLLCLSLPLILLMSLLPLFGARGLPHWEMPGWLFLFPLLGGWMSKLEAEHRCLHRKTLTLSCVSMVAVILLLGSQDRYGWLRNILPEGQKHLDPTRELIEWKGLREALQLRASLQPGQLLISTHWIDAGRIQREVPECTVTVWSQDPRNFSASVNSRTYIGGDALILSRNLNETEINEFFSQHFESIERIPPIVVRNHGHASIEVSLYRAHKMKSIPPAGCASK